MGVHGLSLLQQLPVVCVFHLPAQVWPRDRGNDWPLQEHVFKGQKGLFPDDEADAVALAPAPEFQVSNDIVMRIIKLNLFPVPVRYR